MKSIVVTLSLLFITKIVLAQSLVQPGQVFSTCSPAISSAGDSSFCTGITYQFNTGTTNCYTSMWEVNPTVNTVSSGTPYINIIFPTAGTYTISLVCGCSYSGGNQSDTQLVVSVANCSTGIEQYVVNNNYSVYPNPSAGNFVIETNSTKKQTMQVFDVNGRVVLSQTLNGKTNIDASNLPNGIYNVSLISNEGIVNKRLVIAK